MTIIREKDREKEATGMQARKLRTQELINALNCLSAQYAEQRSPEALLLAGVARILEEAKWKS